MPTQVEIGRHLDLSERRVRDVLKELGIDHTQAGMDEIRLAYIRDMREKAAGRGGNDQALLTQARIRESTANAVSKELANAEAARELVDVSEVEPLLRNWAARGRNAVMAAGERIIEGIESRHGTQLDDDDVNSHLRSALRDIAGYPGQLAGTAE
jgi:phage terminase Nu1 subunit (DNA packaging protein)